MRRAFWCSLQRLSSALSSQTFLISIPVLPQAKTSSHCPHLLMHYFTDPSPANSHRRVMVTQCFTRQPPTSFSAFFTEIRRYSLHLSCLYIWFVGNSKVFRIFYIESRIDDEKFAFSVFFFFPFFSLFDVWVFAYDLTVSTHGDESLLLCFFFFVWCLGKHLIWSIETCGYRFSTRGEPVLLCFSFFFFSLFDVWVSIWFDLLDSSGYGFFFFKII